MTDYREFAESFFSPVIWANEGKPLLVLGIIVIIVAGTLFLHGITPSHNPKQSKFSLYALILLIALIIGTFASSFYVVDSVNRNVAKHNITVKYQTSKLKFLTYNANERVSTARYFDKNSSLNEEITFGFIKGNKEPFLIKRNNSDANFSKIERDIFKPVPQAIFT